MTQIVREVLPISNTKKYAPTITTPFALEAKIAALQAWLMKEKDNSRGRRVVI